MLRSDMLTVCDPTLAQDISPLIQEVV
jgi:hypothetical protein